MALIASFVYGNSNGTQVKLRAWYNTVSGEYTLMQASDDAVTQPQPVSGTFWQTTQPVSGTVTTNVGTGTRPISATSLPLPTGAAADATLTSGSQIAQVRSGSKGSSSAAAVTSTPSGANHQGMDVIIYDGAGNIISSLGGATAAYNATLPTYTDGATATLQTDVNGRLQVMKAWLDAAEDTNNNRNYVQLHPVNADTPVTTLQNAAATATQPASNGIAINMKGVKGLSLQITGTFVGTIIFEATIDDSTWVNVGLNPVSGAAAALTATAPGLWDLPAGWRAWSQFRARVSAYTSGAITAKAATYVL